MRTRRSLLTTGVAGLAGAGCLESTSTPEEPPDDTPADVGDPVPRGTVEVVHWGWHSTASSMANRLDRDLAESFDLEVTTHEDRRSLEMAIADRISTGQPPESFQTVTGDELGRYVTAVTIHDLADLVDSGSPDDYRPGVQATIQRRGEPYAVPVTVDCRNGVSVSTTALSESAIEPNAFEEAPGLASALSRVGDDARCVIPPTAAARLQVFCLELLATTGPSGYREIRTETPRIGTIRPAIERLAELLATERIVTETTRSGVIATLDQQQAPSEWILLRWPGTVGTVSISVTGFPFPKRAGNAHGTSAFLEAISSPVVQEELAELAGMLPARADAAVTTRAEQATWLERAGTVLPSPATGCGLDADERRRAIDCFEPGLLETTPVDEFARMLREALS